MQLDAVLILFPPPFPFQYEYSTLHSGYSAHFNLVRFGSVYSDGDGADGDESTHCALSSGNRV